MHTIIGTAVHLLDLIAQALAWAASRVSPVRGAGVFWHHGRTPLWRAWREPRAWTARLGRLEIIVDLPR
jgi:hypothetical protein